MANPSNKFVIPSEHLKQFHKLENQYTFGKLLNSGKYGHVFEGLMIEKGKKRSIAVKIIDLEKTSNDYRQKFLPKELSALIELKHKYIIKTFDIKILDNYVYIFMEKALGGDILNMLEEKRFENGIPEPRAKKLFKMAAKALTFIHGKGWAHRDIKSENILLFDKKRTVAKLTDFGFSTTCFVPNTHQKLLKDTQCGTPIYGAPEVYKHSPYDAQKCDVWSMGVVLYVMVNNEMPLTGKDVMKMVVDPKPITLEFKNKSLSNDCKDLIQRQLEVDPQKRFTMAQVLDHNWFKDKSKSKVSTTGSTTASPSSQT